MLGQQAGEARLVDRDRTALELRYPLAVDVADRDRVAEGRQPGGRDESDVPRPDDADGFQGAGHGARGVLGRTSGRIRTAARRRGEH